MRQFLTLGLGFGLAATVLTACGQSPEQKAAAAIEDAAKDMAKAGAEMAKAGAAAAAAAEPAASGDQAAKGMEDFAKAMQGMAAALGGNGGKAAEPVSFRDLQTAFPEVGGWKMEKPQGERMTAPVAFSQTETRYTNGSQSIEVKIVDSAFNQILVAPWAMFLTAGYEKETDDGYEKSTTVSGNPGFEKWSDKNKSGEVNIVVAKRFLVSVDGDDLDTVQQLRDFAAKVDLGKLAALAAAAPAAAPAK